MFSVFSSRRTGTSLFTTTPNRWDWALLPIVLSILVALAFGASQMSRPFVLGQPTPISLDPAAAAVLPAAHHPAHVHGAGLLAAVQLRVRHARGQVPGRREGAHPAAGRAAVGAHPGLPGHRHRALHRPVSGQPAGRRVRCHLRHLHVAGLEHGVQPVPVDEDHSAGAERGGARVPPFRLAAVLAPRAAVRHARDCCGT